MSVELDSRSFGASALRVWDQGLAGNASCLEMWPLQGTVDVNMDPHVIFLHSRP